MIMSPSSRRRPDGHGVDQPGERGAEREAGLVSGCCAAGEAEDEEGHHQGDRRAGHHEFEWQRKVLAAADAVQRY